MGGKSEPLLSLFSTESVLSGNLLSSLPFNFDSESSLSASLMLRLVDEEDEPCLECLDLRLSLGVVSGVMFILDEPSDIELTELCLEWSFFKLLLGVLDGVDFLLLLLLFNDPVAVCSDFFDFGDSFIKFG